MEKNNVDLICDIGELAGLFDKSDNLDNFLQTAVSIVAHHMKAAVCSIYLCDNDTKDLVLRANQGLEQDAVGHVILRQGEGVVGQALKESKPINVGRVSESSQFKPIHDIGEERYQSILAVPILRGLTKVGVLAVQDDVADYFVANDINALRAISSQLATVIENAKLLLDLKRTEERIPFKRQVEKEETYEDIRFIKGRSVSSGVVKGSATVIASDEYDVLMASADEHDKENALNIFDQAIADSERQLKELQLKLDEQMADVASMIFSAHLLILRDSEFFGTMRGLVEKGYSPQRAVTCVVNDFIHLFSQSKNPRLKEKVQDAKDLGHRIMQNIEKRGEEHTGNYEGQIVIAEELMPSEFVKLAAQNVEGMIILSGGGVTAHISILARSLQKPVIFASEYKLLEVLDGTQILMDANQGTLFVEPDESVLTSYAELLQTGVDYEKLADSVDDVTTTRDGTRINMLSNINLLSDLKVAQVLKAEGVGLYRSEFPFIVRNSFPSEEEQYKIYHRIISGMDGKEVVLRTLDVGGDKVLPYSNQMHEANPFLGLRAIRFTLANRSVFNQQLRAMLRAGVDANMKIMFPFISSLDDFIEARGVVHECIDQLKREDIPCHENPKMGCMVELPAAVAIMDELARETDFLCIGTNDLIQYLLAVDRTNEAVSNLYIPHHPAVLRALKVIARSSILAGRELSICGDMAADAQMIPFLLGIGIRKFSMDPRAIPTIQKHIQAVDLKEAEELAAKVLKMGLISEVAEFLHPD